MNALEMAFFYGDFTEIREATTALLSEDSENTNTHDEIFAFDSED